MNIRHASLEDLDNIARIEGLSYPSAEGASKTSIKNRIEAFSECFWILEDDEKILAYINGMATNEDNLTDEMYDNANMHMTSGNWQMIFSVATDPNYRKMGYASMVMRQVIEDCKQLKRKGIVLTCKENLLPFYGQFGFENEGVSSSTHGNVLWYQMRLTF